MGRAKASDDRMLRRERRMMRATRFCGDHLTAASPIATFNGISTLDDFALHEEAASATVRCGVT